jgi:hypothetical protein
MQKLAVFGGTGIIERSIIAIGQRKSFQQANNK